jgi:hypothetical protein
MYFSANAGGAFHIWRQQFPNGTPQQMTSGPTEEEGIAMAPDGSSLITSVGTGVSTVWMRDSRGERPLSEEGNSYRPKFSDDRQAVYYLVSERPGAFLANSGALWSVDLSSGTRRRLPLPSTIVDYSVDGQRGDVFFVTTDETPNATLWRAPVDGRTRPRMLATDVLRVVTRIKEDIVFLAFEGSEIYIFAMDPDGRSKRKALPVPVVGLQSVSPDGAWLVVEDRAQFGGDPSPTVLYPLGDPASSRLPLCSACSVDWVGGGRYLSVRFSGTSDAAQRPLYVVPLSPGELLPTLFRQGRLISEAEVATAPGARVVGQGIVTFGADLDSYVYAKSTSHRNLFRIPIE